MVYDKDIELPGCDWTEEHAAQGFARRESAVNFNTLLDFGYADATVSIGAYEPQPEHERAVSVPFLVTSGEVLVEGPEEFDVARSVALPPGNYRLIAAQYVSGEEEVIDLFFEPLHKSAEQSSILVADEALNPAMPLLETAGIAGEE